MLEPTPQKHASPPTAIAISPTSHIVIAASQSPPLVLMKYRQGPWEQLVPAVSKSCVSVIAFHPKKSNLFLLGFKDGGLGLYDANAIVRKGQGRERTSPAKETSSFQKLHSEIRSEEGESHGITGAAFLPGSRLAAVTIGLDGKCKVVSFETKSIKTWSVKAPATSLAVLSLEEKVMSERKAEQVRSKTLASSVKSSSNSPVIAVGRIDGQLRFYNCDGDLLREETIDEMNGAVTDLEWIPGKCRQAIGDEITVDIEKHPLISLTMSPPTSKRASTDQNTKSPGIKRLIPLPHSSEVTTSIRSPNDSKESNEMSSAEASATVRHTDIKGTGLLFPTYMDLFSPIKRPQESPIRTSSPRSRPRLTSTTFVEHLSTPVSPEISKVTNGVSSSMLVEKQESVKRPPIIPAHASPTRLPVKIVQRKVSPKKVTFKSIRSSGPIFNIPAVLLASQDDRLAIEGSSSQSSSNSEILARIRALGAEKQVGSRKVRGNIAALAPYYNSSQNIHVEQRVYNSNESATHRDRRISSSSAGSRRVRRSIGNGAIHGRLAKVKPRPKVERSAEAEIWFTESETESPNRTPKRKNDPPRWQHRNVIKSSNFPEDSTTVSIHTAKSHSFAEIPSSLYHRSSSSERSKNLSTIEDARFGSGPYANSSLPYLENKVTDSNEGTSESTISTRKLSHSSSTSPRLLPMDSSPHLLPPGFAESYQGPVPVEHYLPRRASLNFSTPERPKSESRVILGTLSGNEQRGGETGLGHHHDECDGCTALRARVEKLEQELGELRRALVGRPTEG